jgi:hypothetical protein
VKPELREPRLSRIERVAEFEAFSPGEPLTKAATNEASCFMAFEVPSAVERHHAARGKGVTSEQEAANTRANADTAGGGTCFGLVVGVGLHRRNQNIDHKVDGHL